MSLFLHPHPRAFYLLTDTHALVFRQPEESESKAARSVVVAEFLRIEEVDLGGLVQVGSGRPIVGVLGVTSVPTARSPIPDIFLIFLTATSPLSPILPSSPLRPAKVLAVEFHSLSSSFWDPPSLTTNAGYDDYEDAPSSYDNVNTMQSQAAQQGIESPCNGMRKYLESGSFFLAENCAWDISTRLGQANHAKQDRSPLETFDERFVWNATLLAPLLKFRLGLPESVRQVLDEQALLIPIIQGYCGSKPVSTGNWTANGAPEIASLALISRLSWKRAGARFMTRGIDDDGQVANFVETEVILATEEVCFSYVQIRGSVPLFWQQPTAGLATLQQKVEITRPPQASQPAFDKHFLDLLEHYHSVHAVNLLGQKDAESMLSMAYSEHMAALRQTLDETPISEKHGMDAAAHATVALTPYDFHAASRQGGPEAVKYDFQSGLREVVQSTNDYGWTAIDGRSGDVIESQNGVFRVNCLDCLDRTNFVQDVISSITVAHFLDSIGSALSSSPTFWQAHRELWADNGDRLSKIYAGTGALNTSATRTGKKTFAGLLSDATKSVGRAYITNFQDKGKQNAIDMLLSMMAGQRPVILFDPIGDSIQSELAARVNEFSSTRNVTIFSGTWNLNGEAPGEPLDDWLFPSGSPDADIYMIAFQEIVQLNASQILQTDPAKRRSWEGYIMKTFNHKFGSSEYILYRSEQLVGTALIVVVKASVSPHIRQVESATKKTGLQGLSGNKGGVGIRFNLFDSSICLMTCHLAAGHGNTTERNADYKTISSGLKFLKGKTIDAHDVVIWAADFNYRISLPNLDVREYAETAQLDSLLAADQLAQAMDEGEVFWGYEEGPIGFLPTYKYDNGTDQYDTSEKARIPAWTDRVLCKGSALRLQEYNRAELWTSDHRPVYAVFSATVREVDIAKRDAISAEIMKTIQGHPTERFDDKVERAMRSTKLIDLGSEMTNDKPVTRKPVSSPSPRVPPRPPADTKPIPSNGHAINGLTSSPRKPAPPPPARALPSSTFNSPSPANASIPTTYPTRKAPALPRRSPTEEVTPATSIQLPPALPARPGSGASRATPVPQASLDLNGPPPEGLSPPVEPDRPNSLPKPSVSRKPPPPAPSRSSKPAFTTVAAAASGGDPSRGIVSASTSPPANASPLVINRNAGAKTISAPWITGARPATSTSTPSSPPKPTASSPSPTKSPPKPKPPVPTRKPSIGKAAPPVVPKKPVALRSASQTSTKP